MINLESVLNIFAHPDDESVAVGGINAKISAEGGHSSLLTLTHGEKGSKHLPHGMAKDQLPVIRRAEEMCAAKILGINRVEILDYPDGGLDEVPFAEIVVKVAGVIKKMHPQTILTFGPCGLFGHRDHVATYKIVVEAVKMLEGVGYSPDLYGIEYPKEMDLAHLIANRKKTPNHYTTFTQVAASQCELVDITPYFKTKSEAILCYKSQGPERYLECLENFKEYRLSEYFLPLDTSKPFSEAVFHEDRQLLHQ